MWRGTSDGGSTGVDRVYAAALAATRARALLALALIWAKRSVAMSLGAVVTAAVAANRLKRRPSTSSPHTSRNPTGSGHSHDPLTMSFKSLGEAEGCGALLAAMSAEPKQVATLAQKKVVAVSAGDYSTLAVTAGGVVYSFGSGFHGLLGHGDEEWQLLPKQVAGLAHGI